MSVGGMVSQISLFVALGAFALTGALSLAAEVEPLYVVLRSIAAFLAVLYVTRVSASVLDSLR